MFGLSQPILLKGFNVAGTYFFNRVTFEYSHGMGLNFDYYGRTTEEKNPIEEDSSGGVGSIGRGRNEWDLLVEPNRSGG